MDNYILLKWNNLNEYVFTNEFRRNNMKLVEELDKLWLETSNKTKEYKLRLIDVLKKFYDLGVVFQNDFTDEYFNNFEEIKNYILN